MAYLPKLNPTVGGGLGGLPERASDIPEQRGEIIFTGVGINKWTVPLGVTSVCVVCVGGGAAGNSYPNNDDVWGGGGGGLGWANDIVVVPGDVIDVVVGDGGHYRSILDVPVVDGPLSGGDSYFDDGSTCKAYGSTMTATTCYGGSYVGEGGGQGGHGQDSQAAVGLYASGAGAGGYSGNGGAGLLGNTTAAGNDGSGGGGGGGGINTAATNDAGGGGGVGLFGEGANGAGGDTTTLQGGGGSNGEDGLIVDQYSIYSSGGKYGGGGAGYENSTNPKGAGGQGAVRILWGKGRAFPSTDVGQS